MATADLRGEAEDDFREGRAYTVSLKTDFGGSSPTIEVSEDKFGLSPTFDFEISERERLAQILRRKYDDKVVAVSVTTGEELAVADDTHKLVQMLRDLEYNEEATMIVRCHGGQERGHRTLAEEVLGAGPRTGYENR